MLNHRFVNFYLPKLHLVNKTKAQGNKLRRLSSGKAFREDIDNDIWLFFSLQKHQQNTIPISIDGDKKV